MKKRKGTSLLVKKLFHIFFITSFFAVIWSYGSFFFSLSTIRWCLEGDLYQIFLIWSDQSKDGWLCKYTAGSEIWSCSGLLASICASFTPIVQSGGEGWGRNGSSDLNHILWTILGSDSQLKSTPLPHDISSLATGNNRQADGQAQFYDCRGFLIEYDWLEMCDTRPLK